MQAEFLLSRVSAIVSGRSTGSEIEKRRPPHISERPHGV